MPSAGRMQKLDGEWQGKGECEISLEMLRQYCDDEAVQLILIPPDDLAQNFSIPSWASNVVTLDGSDLLEEVSGDLALLLRHLKEGLAGLKYLAASYLYRGDDLARIARLDAWAQANGLCLLATNSVQYHAPERRPLHDVMSAIRNKTTVAKAGDALHPNGERYLKSPAEMQRLFARWPHAIAAARAVADACDFSLEELKYEYPEEIYPDRMTPQEYLESETWAGAERRYPEGTPEVVRETLERELALIAKLDLARYFLTIKDIVDFARSVDPPILCQGRGSAANSAVCYCLEITSVDPAKHQLLFDRFISEERKEPPDIDVDFEHERRWRAPFGVGMAARLAKRMSKKSA